MGTNGNGNGNGARLGANLAYTKFLFIVPRQDDDGARARLRGVSDQIARGFFNDFDADGSRELQPRETIHFLRAETPSGTEGIARARYAVQVSASYRPRLQDVELEVRRRLGDHASVLALDGAVRAPRYTSAELHEHAYRNASARLSGRAAPNAIVVPISKTAEWWNKDTLERHAYLYPHVDDGSGAMVKGHARTAEAGVTSIFRQLFHNPDGYQREGEFDFLSYFECADEHLPTFERVRMALQDDRQNPEWRFVIEGPEWRGRRVLRW